VEPSVTARREVLLDRLLELNPERYGELARWVRGDRLELPPTHPFASGALRARHLAWLAFGEARRAGDTLTLELLRPWATLEPPRGPRGRVAWVAGHITVQTGWPCTVRVGGGFEHVEYSVHERGQVAMVTHFQGDHDRHPFTHPEAALAYSVARLRERMNEALGLARQLQGKLSKPPSPPPARPIVGRQTLRLGGRSYTIMVVPTGRRSWSHPVAQTATLQGSWPLHERCQHELERVVVDGASVFVSRPCDHDCILIQEDLTDRQLFLALALVGRRRAGGRSQESQMLSERLGWPVDVAYRASPPGCTLTVYHPAEVVQLELHELELLTLQERGGPGVSELVRQLRERLPEDPEWSVAS
jgi:hypothetical protein